RNVKMYLGDIPLTDAGGNTYLNLLDPGAVSGMEVLKGPDGSLFGANSGGVVILRPADPDPTEIRIQGGSYGLLHQQAGVGVRVSDQYRFNLHQSFQHSDGYRDHAALRRHYIQTIHHWHYRRNRPNQLRAHVLYGDLDYQTP